MLAEDRCLPMQMNLLGDRLVGDGIGVLLGITALIIVIRRGDTTVAVNLYAWGCSPPSPSRNWVGASMVDATLWLARPMLMNALVTHHLCGVGGDRCEQV